MIVNSTMLKNYTSILNTQSQSGVNALGKNDFTSKMQQISNQLLSSLDTNKNGSIDRAEFSSAAMQLAQGTVDADKLFRRLDQNSDGKIDGNELLSALELSQPETAQSSKKSNTDAYKNNTLLEQNSIVKAVSNENAKKGLQSVLMKNILSAYITSQSQTNGGSLSITA